MVRKPVEGSPKARGRQGIRTDTDFVSVSDFEAAIMDLDGSAESRNLLVYGDSGSGKTVLAGTCPRSLILACEPGYISAANTSLGVPVGRRQVRIIKDGPTALAALDYLEGGGAKKYDWIILEGGSTLDTKLRLGYAAAAFDGNPESRTARNLPDKPDYFNTQNYLRSFFLRFVDLPVNTLTTAHAMRMDDDSGDRLVLPAFQQKEGVLSNFVCGLMHSVGFMRPVMKGKGDDKVQVRRIRWQQHVDPDTGTIYFAKDQFNAFGRFKDDTNIVDLMTLVDKKAANATAAPARRKKEK
jgi:hypothetical protein